MHWPGFCAEADQSPIDVCGANEKEGVAVETLAFSDKYSEVHNFKFSSDGKAYLDASGLGMSMTAGKLSHITRPSNPDEQATWNLAQAHFHWYMLPVTLGHSGYCHYLFECTTQSKSKPTRWQGTQPR